MDYTNYSLWVIFLGGGVVMWIDCWFCLSLVVLVLFVLCQLITLLL